MADPFKIGRGYTTRLATAGGDDWWCRSVNCRRCDALLGGVAQHSSVYVGQSASGHVVCAERTVTSAAAGVYGEHACEKAGESDIPLYSVRLTDAGKLSQHEGKVTKIGGQYMFVHGSRWCEDFPPRAKRRVVPSQTPVKVPHAGAGIGCVFGESLESLEHARSLMVEFMVESSLFWGKREMVILTALGAAMGWVSARSLRDSLRRKHCDDYNMAQDLRTTLRRWAAVGWTEKLGKGSEAKWRATPAGVAVLQRKLQEGG